MFYDCVAATSYGMEVKKENILHAFEARESKTKSNVTALIILAVIDMLLIGYFIYSRNYSASLLFFLAGIIAGFSVFKRKPSVATKCKIRKEGVQVNATLYPYEYLKSFWIFYDPPYQAEISLRSKKTLVGYIRIPLGEEDPVKIRELLIKFMPEKKQKESITDIFAKVIGL